MGLDFKERRYYDDDEENEEKGKKYQKLETSRSSLSVKLFNNKNEQFFIEPNFLTRGIFIKEDTNFMPCTNNCRQNLCCYQK